MNSKVTQIRELAEEFQLTYNRKLITEIAELASELSGNERTALVKEFKLSGHMEFYQKTQADRLIQMIATGGPAKKDVGPYTMKAEDGCYTTSLPNLDTYDMAPEDTHTINNVSGDGTIYTVRAPVIA